MNKEKIISEIGYFSSEIVAILNDLNNISINNYQMISEKINISQNENNSDSSSKSSGNESQQSQENNVQNENDGQNSKSNNKKEVNITKMQERSILQTNTEDIDWKSIKNKIELVNSSWNVVMLDLYKANTQNNDIIEFGNLLNKSIVSIKNEDKDSALVDLANLYSYIPKFLKDISAEKSKQNIEQTKYNILVSYSSATLGDWNTTYTSIAEAESIFLNVLKDTEYSKNKEFKINKIYMLIKELQNSVGNNDKQLYYIKYRNLMEILNTI